MYPIRSIRILCDWSTGPLAGDTSIETGTGESAHDVLAIQDLGATKRDISGVGVTCHVEF